MSMLLLNQYHKNTKPNARHDQNGPEPPPEVGVSLQPEQDEQDDNGAGGETKEPVDPDARREKALKDAQARWAQRRNDGYEDYGAEMGKDARVWETYVKETDRADHELVEGWNKSLDVLLIFAALFSAISTAFVIVSSEGLQQDPADTSAQTLLTISQALVAISNGQPANASATTEQDPSTSFKPTRAAVIVNTLWYFSLSLSVAVSLVAMLAKEWCYSFMANRTGQMYEQGRRRQERWNGILRWKMKDVIAFLPMVMHSALFLFALGLCVYLWDMYVPVALPVVVTTGVALLTYFSTTALPLVFDFCPYTTESSRLLQSYIVLIHRGASALLNRMAKAPRRKSIDPRERFRNWKRVQHQVLSRIDGVLKSCAEGVVRVHTIIRSVPVNSVSIADPKLIMANGKVPMDLVTSEMLAWLLANSEDSTVTTIALRSLAGADPWLPRLPLLRNGALRLLHQRLEGCLELDVKQNEYRLRDPASVHSASLYIRGLNFILLFHNSEGFYLHYPLRWISYRSHLVHPKLAESKNTWDLDLGAANISSLLTAGTHGSDFKLTMDWTQSPELALFGDIYPQAIKYMGNYVTDFTTPCYVDRVVRQTDILTLLGCYIDETIVVHTHAIATIVRRETELLCARYAGNDGLSPADQLAFPILLAKLSCLPSIQGNLDTLNSIAIALAVTAFAFVEDSLQKHPSTHPSLGQSRPSVAASYHYQPKVITNMARQYLSPEASMRKETESLLTFGLLALLEHSNAHALCNADVAAITQAIESAGRNQSLSNPITYVHIHTLSNDFTYADHNQRVMNRLYSANPDEFDCNTAIKWHCMQALHDTQCISDECSHYILHLKRWCHAKNAELRAVLFEMIRARRVLHNPPEQELHDLLSTSDVLVRLDSTLLISINAQDILFAMELLWKLVEWIYENRDESGRQVLSPITPENSLEIPSSIWRLGLIERWLPKLKSVCSIKPQLVTQSRVIQDIIQRFESEWQYRLWNRFGGLENPSRNIVERAAQRYQQDPNQCRQTPSVEAIHKLAFECVSEHRKQNGSTPLPPPPDIRIPSRAILPGTLENSPIVPEMMKIPGLGYCPS